MMVTRPMVRPAKPVEVELAKCSGIAFKCVSLMTAAQIFPWQDATHGDAALGDVIVVHEFECQQQDRMRQ